MTNPPNVALSFKDVDVEEEIREEVRRSLEERCRSLGSDFPEASQIEVSFVSEGDLITGHAHVTGKRTEAATHASAPELPLAADLLFDRLVKQLRRAHDKRIFTHRREAMQHRREG